MTITDEKLVTYWNQINWKKAEVEVFKLQKQIYQASQQGSAGKSSVC
jgi:RNA-directed DNA polymerase